MKFCLDLDGVVSDFDGAFQRFAENLLARPVIRLSNAYYLHHRYNITKQEMIDVLEHMQQQSLWRDIQPYADAREAISLIREAGHEISMITASAPEVESQRRESLESLGIHNEVIHFVGVISPTQNKKDALIQESPDTFLDDQLFNLDVASQVTAATLAWIDRGDTQPHPEGHEYCRQNDWKKYASLKSHTLLEAVQEILVMDYLFEPEESMIRKMVV